jgi:hypothetical protein
MKAGAVACEIAAANSLISPTTGAISKPPHDRRKTVSRVRCKDLKSSPSSAANPHAGAVVAVRMHGRGVHDRSGCGSMRDDRAARADASRVINAGRACGGVGVRGLNGEQAQNQQTVSDLFH